MGKLSESVSYIEPANDFYGNQNLHIENKDIFNKMGTLYNRRLNQILEKTYDNQVGKGAGERLLEKVIRDGNKIQFIEYLKYLVDSGKISSQESFDDVDQIGELKDKLRVLKEEIEDLGPKDFEIIKGNIGSYEFKGANSFKYLGNNFYEIKIDFEKARKVKWKIKKFFNLSGSLNFNSKKGNNFYIHYEGNNVINYYYGNSFQNKKLLGYEVIDHKEEIVRDRNKIYLRGAEEQIYLRGLGMHLTLKFFKKQKN